MKDFLKSRTKQGTFYLNGLYDSNDERPISGRSKFPSYSNG